MRKNQVNNEGREKSVWPHEKKIKVESVLLRELSKMEPEATEGV